MSEPIKYLLIGNVDNSKIITEFTTSSIDDKSKKESGLIFSKMCKKNPKNFEERIIGEFYEKQSNKMKDNLSKFYDKLHTKYYKEKFIHSSLLEFQSLCNLRNYVFYEENFNINDLAEKLLIFPMKYLNIVIKLIFVP